MGATCCKPTEPGAVDGPLAFSTMGVRLAPAAPGTWDFGDLDFSEEPKLQLCVGATSSDDQGLEASTPELELARLQEECEAAFAAALAEQGLPASTAEYPPATTDEEACQLLEALRSGEVSLWETDGKLCMPEAAGKGLRGLSPLHVASVPESDADAYGNTLFFCLEEKVGFGVVWQGTWGQLWFHMWTSSLREAVTAGKQLLVLTMDDGSLSFQQSVEVLWLQQEGVAFRSMRARSFLLQVRPLLQAALQEQDDAVEELLASAPQRTALHHRDSRGCCAVHVLARTGRDRLLTLAIQAGARADAACFQGLTALGLAAREGHEAVVRELLAANADKDCQSPAGLTPLFLASQSGSTSCMQLLLKEQADLERSRSDGATPLLVASYQGHSEAVQALLAARADAGRATTDGFTALDAARHLGHGPVVRLLEAAGE